MISDKGFRSRHILHITGLLSVLVVSFQVQAQNPFWETKSSLLYDQSGIKAKVVARNWQGYLVQDGVATMNLTNQISIVWLMHPDANSYRVYRSVSGSGGFSLIGEVASTSFQDLTCVQGVKYYYELTAVSRIYGESLPTVPFSGIKPFPPPTIQVLLVTNHFLVTNQPFVVQLRVSKDNGFWSTNYHPFSMFTNSTNILISHSVVLQYYGANAQIAGPVGTNIYVFQYMVFVSMGGNDTNSGLSPSFAVKSLQKAVNKAKSVTAVQIKVMSGNYTRGSGLCVSSNAVSITGLSNLRISGGWDAGFMTNLSVTVLDGGMAPYRMVFESNLNNCIFENFRITGGQASDSGGGLETMDVNGSWFNGLVLSNNAAATNGGGAAFIRCNQISFNAISVGNTAMSGGGLFLSSSTGDTIIGSFYGNTASIAGGGLYLLSSTGNSISGSVNGNTSSGSGGGIYDTASLNNLSCNVNNNTAVVMGGGMLFSGSEMVTGSVSGNHSGQSGGGMEIIGGNGVFSGSIVSNGSSIGGGIHTTSSGWGISGNITGNTAAASGGAVYFSAPYCGFLTNASLTNNPSQGLNAIVVISNSLNINPVSLVIRNVVFGQTNGANAFAIYEAGANDVQGQTIIGNLFYTNQMSVLYHDATGTNILNADWTNINNPVYSGASTASGNNVGVR